VLKKDLHRLPVRLCIEYKIIKFQMINLTHNILHGRAPVYLQQLVKHLKWTNHIVIYHNHGSRQERRNKYTQFVGF
jgi:hypothetical protein